jgi:hypothetical protein
MARRVLPFAAAAALFLDLAGCSNYEAQRPAWRAEAENACLAQNLIQESAYVRPVEEISGPGICGLTHPFKVAALLDGQVMLDGDYILDCPMIAALNAWVRDVVEPAAQTHFNERAVEITTFGTYSCRGINGEFGARLSEHAFGNAIDVSGFRLQDGRSIVIARDWTRGDPQSQAFLRDVDNGACGDFTTVLGPGYNFLHYNHFHLDLAMRGNMSTGPRRVCKPHPDVWPQNHAPDGLPEPPPVDEEMDVSQAGSGDGQPVALHTGPDSPDASLPAPPPYAPPRSYDRSYQALSSDALPPAPVQPSQDSAGRAASLRADGAYVPEGRAADWDMH